MTGVDPYEAGGTYVPIFDWLFRIPGVQMADAYAYGVLVSFRGRGLHAQCWPSMPTIAKRLGVEREDTARQRIRRLRQLGLICVEPQRGRSNLYTFPSPEDVLGTRSTTPVTTTPVNTTPGTESPGFKAQSNRKPRGQNPPPPRGQNPPPPRGQNPPQVLQGVDLESKSPRSPSSSALLQEFGERHREWAFGREEAPETLRGAALTAAAERAADVAKAHGCEFAEAVRRLCDAAAAYQLERGKDFVFAIRECQVSKPVPTGGESTEDWEARQRDLEENGPEYLRGGCL